MVNDRIGERLPDNVLDVLAVKRGMSHLCAAKGFSNGEVAFWLMWTSGIDPKDRASRQGPNILVDRERLRYSSPEIEPYLTHRIRIARDLAAREHRLDLRGEAKGPTIIRVVERLDAVGIASKQEPPAQRIPDGKREHPPQ